MKTYTFALAVGAMISATSAQAVPIALTNAYFEAHWDTVGLTASDGLATFYYGPSGPGMGWDFPYIAGGGGAGIAPGYALLSAYEGNQFGFLQLGNPDDPFGLSGSHFSQFFTLGADAPVTVSFAVALRPDYSSGQQIAVAVDGQIAGVVAATDTAWTVQSVSLGSLSAGNHTLAFAGTADYATFGDTTAFIDAVQLNAAPVPEPKTWSLLLAGLGLVGFAARSRGVTPPSTTSQA